MAQIVDENDGLVDGMLAAVATETSLEKPEDTARWSAEEFRTYHLASMYLPLRYRAWHGLESRHNPATEHRLRLLSHGVSLPLERGISYRPA